MQNESKMSIKFCIIIESGANQEFDHFRNRHCDVSVQRCDGGTVIIIPRSTDSGETEIP